MLSPSDLEQLKAAKTLLETNSLAVRLQNLVGKPLIEGVSWLPKGWQKKVNSGVEAALERALSVAIKSLEPSSKTRSVAPTNLRHKAMIAASGAFGGAFGLPALLVELPVSTTIMMRSIANIAQSEGEDLSDVEARLACVEVFALGGTGPEDDYADTGYYAVRAILAQQVTETIRHLAQGGTAHAAATPIARLIASIGSRFGIVVGEKALAAAIPVLGAAGGAMINTLFIDHFQNVARGHFVVRRLERQYGADAVRAAYDGLSS